MRFLSAPGVLIVLAGVLVGIAGAAQTQITRGEQLFKEAAAHAQRGETELARSKAEEARAISRADRQPSVEANCMLLLGQLEMDARRYREALVYFRESLPLWSEAKNWAGGATALSNAGSAYREVGDYTQALDAFQSALKLRKLIGDRSGEAATMVQIGLAYMVAGQSPEGIDTLKLAMPMLVQTGNKLGAAKVATTIGQYYENRRELAAALDYYQQYLSLARELGDQDLEARALADIRRASSKVR